MRGIKFRQWDSVRNRYYCEIGITGEGSWAGPTYVTWAKYPLEQFTGLHDKNGKEIYEGDVLHTNEADWIAKVIWNYDGFMLTGLDNTGFSCSPDYDKCEVVGNIHENPELIEDTHADR